VKSFLWYFLFQISYNQVTMCMKYITAVSLISFVLLLPTISDADPQKFSSWQSACAAAETSVAEGDIIFLEMPDFVFRKVAESTRTWTSHVGLVFKDKGGHWVVSESTIPFSKDTVLCDFLKTSSEYRFEIKRLHRPLQKFEIARLRSSAVANLGKFYHLGFDFDSNWFFCSKFVYLAYKTIGVEVGKIETFRQLLEENPVSSVLFWKIWFLGFIPWERRTITPASQLQDSQFVTVLSAS
jgi:hypothetical protein